MSIRTSQDKDTANVLVFETTLREVLIVNTQTVKYKPKPKKGATKRQVNPKQSSGEQQGKNDPAIKKSSLGIKFKGSVTDSLGAKP